MSDDVQERRARFMRLRGTAHQIHMFLSRNKLSVGINWSGSTKGNMAKYYAERSIHIRITEEAFKRLEQEFGLRPSKV